MPPHTDCVLSSASRDRPAACHTHRLRQTPQGAPESGGGGRRAQERSQSTRLPADRQRAALATPTMLAAWYGARPAPGPLDAGRAPGRATRSTVPAAQHVRGEPSVGCDHDCHGAYLGLSLPQATSPPEASTMCEVEGEGWRGSSLVAIPLCIRLGVFSVVIETRWPTR